MTSTDLTAAFPPVFAAETTDTTVTFAWLDEPVPVMSASALLVTDGGDSAIITGEPTPAGSRLYATDRGMVLHLAASDAASMKDRAVIFGVWLNRPVMDGEPDQAGLIVVSDWAVESSKGIA